MNIRKIKIVGFKSISGMALDDVSPYSVFAGPNGAGKSNLADALGFVGSIISLGATRAIRKYNGFSHIHCRKFKKSKARTFEFVIETIISNDKFLYTMKLHDMDTSPTIEESLIVSEKQVMKRKKFEPPVLFRKDGTEEKPSDFPHDISGLMLLSQSPLYQFLNNIRIFRFDPIGAKEPDSSSTDAGELDIHGRNVATMLSALEEDDDFRNQIYDWLELIVPGMEKVATEQQRLDGRTVITFKEEGIRAHFPANLISDGTIYALCIMTAILSRSRNHGLTFIEEPERGIHPKAIAELIELMRGNASTGHPVFVTTHSESVVRASHASELWLVNKQDGKTIIKNAALHSTALGDLNLDKAWLMNMFDGGLPW